MGCTCSSKKKLDVSAPQPRPARAPAGAPAAPAELPVVEEGETKEPSCWQLPRDCAALTLNGFTVVPEPPSIDCREEGVAPFSLPMQALTHEPGSSSICTKFKNGDEERKIHCNIELKQAEIEKLAVMREEAEDAQFYPCVAAMATRFLSHCRMDTQKAVRHMKETHQWRQEYFKDGPISDDSMREDLGHGIVYFVGRDQALRPLVVVRASRVPKQWYSGNQVDRLTRVLIFHMEYFMRYMVVPGKLENLSVLVDLRGLQVSQVPLGALGQVYKVLSNHYAGRVYRFYACNLSWSLSLISELVMALLTDRQKQKLHILKSTQELRQDFAPHQLEEDLGGSRSVLTCFWPFQLNPGPYAAGSKAEPDRSERPHAHRVLTPAGTLGQLWDPARAPHENRRLEYNPEAVDILRAAGVPEFCGESERAENNGTALKLKPANKDTHVIFEDTGLRENRNVDESVADRPERKSAASSICCCVHPCQ